MGALAAVAMLAACGTGAMAAQGPKKGASGDPVPRYVSLRYDEVNARVGPGETYDVRWAYKTRGLPLQVIAETAGWIRVCDPEGEVAWVALRMGDPHRRTVMRVRPEPLPLRRRPAPDSAPVARLGGRSIADLESCRDGWCQVSAGRIKGWAPQGELWGADDAFRCRPPLPRVRR